MSTTKIHIDLKLGVLEAEGSEVFVEKIYRDFKENIKLGIDLSNEKVEKSSERKIAKASTSKKINPKKTKVVRTNAKKRGLDATLVKDLDLKGDKTKPSLRDFYKKYEIKTNMERNLVFCRYLENELGIKEFGVNHVFTCYRNILGIKIPGNIKQSLYDTSIKGWININSIDNDISVPVMGTNYF